MYKPRQYLFNKQAISTLKYIKTGLNKFDVDIDEISIQHSRFN